MIFPSFPILVCLKNTGPLDSNLIANAIIKKIGDNTTKAIEANTTSIILFMYLYIVRLFVSLSYPVIDVLLKIETF